MSPVARIMHLIWREERRGLTRGAALAVTVLAAGVALLGLSGWFITAASAAGLAGIGILFNLFQPSAGVRMLALGRAAARYGERLLTHDAVLKTLTNIRVRLLRSLFALPFTQLSRLRGAEALNRLVADVNALDGVALRLYIPGLAMALVFGGSFLIIGWLTAWPLALWVLGVFSFGAIVAMRRVARLAGRPSRLAEKGQQAFRMRLIDTLRARDDLVVYGRFSAHKHAVHDAERRMNDSLTQADRVERRAALLLSLTATLAAGGALWLGASLVQSGEISAAQAALAFFAALALAEATGPLQRGLADLGRIQQAARNVTRILDTAEQAKGGPTAPAILQAQGPALRLQAVHYRHPGADRTILNDFSLELAPGETVALTGPSGGGKSTVLSLAAGLVQPDAGEISLFGSPIAQLPEPQLRQLVGLLPQRSAILGGSFFEVLALADPELSEDRAFEVLEATALSATVMDRGGLHAALRDNGAGLSGGEQRRLALARCLLRSPKVLLLDEPTEGLDPPTAARALAGIRDFAPQASILTASHRRAEKAWADRESPMV